MGAKRGPPVGCLPRWALDCRAALAGQLSFPKRLVFNLAGDGAAADGDAGLDTEVRYHLPIINVVFSNNALGYIEDEQEDDGHEWFGIDMPAIDFATVAKGMGMTGITVTQLTNCQRLLKQLKPTGLPANQP